MVAVVNSGDDLVLVEYGLELRVRVVRIPFLCLWSETLQEQEALCRERIKGIDIDRMLLQDGAVVECPGLVAVDGSVRVVRLKLVVELVLDNQAVVVLIGSAGLCLLLGLSDLALSEKSDPLVICECPVWLELVDESDFTHVCLLS